MRLYDFGDYIFAVTEPPYVDAWGQHKVVGTLFDVIDGTVQVGALLSCNVVAHRQEHDLVRVAAKAAVGLDLLDYMEI